MFQTLVVEKIKTHFVLNNFLFFQNLAVYEIMWIAGQATDDNKTRRTRIACWVPKDTNTRLE